jgi:hypothetical protein
MAITLAQTPAANHNASSASINVTLGSAATAGNKLIAVLYIFDNTRTIKTPTGYTLVLSHNPASSGQAIYWYEKEAAGGETAVTVATSDDQVDTIGGVLYEVTELTDDTAFDKSATQNLTTSVVSKTTGTTATLAQADEIAIGAVMVNGDISAESWSNSFTGSGKTSRLYTAYKVVSATTGVETTMSWTTQRSTISAIATFKAAATSTQPPRASHLSRLRRAV